MNSEMTVDVIRTFQYRHLFVYISHFYLSICCLVTSNPGNSTNSASPPLWPLLPDNMTHCNWPTKKVDPRNVTKRILALYWITMTSAHFMLGIQMYTVGERANDVYRDSSATEVMLCLLSAGLIKWGHMRGKACHWQVNVIGQKNKN